MIEVVFRSLNFFVLVFGVALPFWICTSYLAAIYRWLTEEEPDDGEEEPQSQSHLKSVGGTRD